MQQTYKTVGTFKVGISTQHLKNRNVIFNYIQSLKNVFKNQIWHCNYLKLLLLFQIVKKRDVLVHTHTLRVKEFRTIQITFQYD